MTFYQRMSRDPVLWVTLSLFLVLIPHALRLPLWIQLLVPALFLWRLLAIQHERFMPNKWLLFLITILASIGTVFHYGTLFGKTAGTAILAVLLVVKLLESTQKRDYMLLVSLSFFIIVTNFLFSQSIPTVLFMLFTVIVLIMTLIIINQDDAPLDLKSRFQYSFKLALIALPMMLVFFVLFPRIPGPLWKLPDDAVSARTGLSETMTPGKFSELIESNDVAFRVEFNGTPPQQQQLYWRALVLWYFDGRSWEQGKDNRNPSPLIEGFSAPVSYTVTLEPHDRKWLFALDIPKQAPKNSLYNNNFLLRHNEPVKSLHQYVVESFLDYRIEKRLSFWEKSTGLKLPANSNPKTIALARRWQQQYQHPEQIVRQALTYFNQQNFHYTLRPPLTPGFDPVDQFLFETQRGFCEHYASSFTVLMRAAGIPARVVIGYQGGTINPLNNFLTVRQSDAHAWSEVWLKDKGWLRIDPTAAIAPQRIERNLDAALPENEFRPIHMRIDGGLVRNIKFYWDALDNEWKQWVIGYSPELQRQLLTHVFNKNINYSDIVLLLVTTILLVVLVTSILIFKPVKVSSKDPVQKIYDKFCSKIAASGLIRHPHQGPMEFAYQASEQFPQHRQIINLVTSLYINAKYRSNYSDQQLLQMKQLVKKMKLTSNQ